MEFKIIIPEQNMKSEDIERRNRAFFTEDFNKGGILAKVLVFTKLNQPVSTTEITKILNDYFKMDFDRASVYRALQKLNEKNIITTTSSGIVQSLTLGERLPIHTQILEKYYAFLHKIPTQFRTKFQNVNYFWVSNGEGMKYIEWCCNLLNFKCEKTKDKE